MNRRRGGMADAEDLKSSEGRPSCGFESRRRHYDTDRHETTNPDNSKELRQGRSTDIKGPSRQNPSTSDLNRPQTATKSATKCYQNCYPLSAPVLPPDLAEVAHAWPDLPEALKAGILAMGRASNGTQ